MAPRASWTGSDVSRPLGNCAPWVNMKTFAGVTATVKPNKTAAAFSVSIRDRPTPNHPATMAPPAKTSTTPVHLTWKLGRPGTFQNPQAPLFDKRRREAGGGRGGSKSIVRQRAKEGVRCSRKQITVGVTTRSKLVSVSC